MNTITLNINAPFFPGYYESCLLNSDTSYWAEKDELEYFADVKNCSAKDVEDFLKSKNFTLEFDYTKYINDMNNSYIAACQDELEYIFDFCKLEFVNLHGYCQEILDCKLTLDKDEFLEKIESNKPEFEKYLRNFLYEKNREIWIVELDEDFKKWDDEDIQLFIEFLLKESNGYIEDKILQECIQKNYVSQYLNFPADLYDYDIPLQECKVDSNN